VLEFCKETAFPGAFPPGYSPDRQSLLQHLLPTAADLAFMWENGVLMVNRQAQPLWRNGGPPQQPSISKGNKMNSKWRVL